MRIRLERPRYTDKQYVGEKWRPCHLCGPSWNETNDDTEETNWFGRHYPESLMTYRDGKWLCNVHHRWRYHNKDWDKVKLDKSEEDREGPVKGNTLD